MIINWPNNKSFAFTIFDDTDNATIRDKNITPVYDLLYDLGFITTKTVWPTKGQQKPLIGGDTCEDLEYLEWVLNLKKKGFEISYHNNTFHTSIRADIIKGLEKFKYLFENYPKTMANHAGCEDGIYWGSKRFSGVYRKIYNLITNYKYDDFFKGDKIHDKLFWGDICRDKIKYVRNFTYRNINTLKVCPEMPYHDENKEYVNYWFASSEGANVKLFNKTISEKNQDLLEEEGGCCIMYTHLASQFCIDGKLNKEFVRLMTRLSKKKGWYVPTYKILDYLIETKKSKNISYKELSKLQKKWLTDRIITKIISKFKN